ncbi:hypothetical protein CERSUDRAFT_89973 [Gelatoporia subvermispora B]|uniref:PHD-type domain-containing protein n=1 Tax=Ceriporiopsis subvermispora (strain B) TaxID=914234 RepID=M2QWD9_CERS8|nr:hypothetical protein CERSUDRAFT_89973 [Gelatoporia subvermispora B]
MLQGSPDMKDELDLSGVGGRFEQRKPQGEQFTPTRNHGSLMPPFGMNNVTHLPTPQSPGTYDGYSSTFAYDPESPAPNGLQNSRAVPFSMFETAADSQRPDEVLSTSGSFITPESSPLMPRRALSPVPAPIPGPSFFPRTPRAHSPPRSAPSTAPTLADPYAITPPSLSNSREITPSSRLSSPFMERLSLTERPSSKNRAQRSRRSPSSDRSPSVPVDVDDLFSPLASTSKSPPPLSAPIPQRPVGGEIQRIRLQLAAEQAAHLHQTEARRPDYLIREKRAGAVKVDDPEDRESVQPSLGVTVSPNKGRRLKLFQETSEETFEQSLLAGGYPGYGSPTATGEPHTPVSKSSSLSQRAMQWLQQATPGKPGPSSIPSEQEVDWVPSEKEIRKRKRLAAFQDIERTHEPLTKLHPVEIEGKGRVIVDVPPEDAVAVTDMQDSPAKRRGNRRKRRGNANTATPRKKGHVIEPEADHTEVLRPNWVDTAFPWCMRSQERAESMRMEQEEKLKWIERFLDRDSEDEDEPEDQTLEPAVRLVDDDMPPRGRGKWVPLRADPAAPAMVANDKLLVPNDPADARAALLSKRSVRLLANRHKLRRRGGDALCICHGTDDGRGLVQCDECQTWYHLDCIGIDISDLGEEEDPWFCGQCLGVPLLSSDPASEPTFVPTDDRPLTDEFRDPPFFQGGLQESPAGPWGPHRTPHTPPRTRDSSQMFASRPSWGDSSRPGPSTPVSMAQNVRVWNTPGSFDPHLQHGPVGSPFDPTTTPSRGLKFAPGTTPKTSLWSARGGPGRDFWRAGDSGGFPVLSDSGGLQLNSYRNIYSYDDTPVRRSEPRDRTRMLTGRKLWDTDSPVPARAALGDLQGSPLPRGARAHAELDKQHLADD